MVDKSLSVYPNRMIIVAMLLILRLDIECIVNIYVYTGRFKDVRTRGGRWHYLTCNLKKYLILNLPEQIKNKQFNRCLFYNKGCLNMILHYPHPIKVYRKRG